MEGKSFNRTRTVTKKDEAGNRVRSEVSRPVKRAWFTGEGGKIFFQLRYGAKPLELAKGMTAIEVDDNLDGLTKVIDTLDQAVQAGEFDAIVAAAAQERAKALKGRRKAKT